MKVEIQPLRMQSFDQQIHQLLTKQSRSINSFKQRIIFIKDIIMHDTIFFNNQMPPNFKLLSLLLLLHICYSTTIQQDIQTLSTKLYNTYWSKDVPFKMFSTWSHMEGLYQSDIHFNIVDKKNKAISALIRRKGKIDDQNMFVTSFVLYGLLEAEQMGTVKVDHHLFSRSLQTLGSFRDKNSKFGIPKYTFWPQAKIDGIWSSQSVNLFNLIDQIPNIPARYQKFLSSHGLGIWIYAKEIKKQFCIPADTDDSSVNIALLGYMQEVQSQHFQFWKSWNFNLDAFYDQILAYAYRPFTGADSPMRNNEIDPRTYFIIHNFLKTKKDAAIAEGKQPTLTLATTWMLNNDEKIVDKIRMPFDVNNVDASVNANFLFGLILQMQGGYQPKPQVRSMARDITDFIVYAVEDAVDRRPDLILMYYPSKYDFYWFVGRLVGVLERMKSNDEDLLYIKEKLSNVMRGKGTDKIVGEKMASKEGFYWVEFLGNFGKKNRTQDSIYSTAMAVNSLLDTWGIKGQKSFKYIGTTPQAVKKAIQGGVNFIRSKLKSNMGRLNNAFFSGSLKILMKDYPASYPANHIYDKNHTSLDAQTLTFNDVNRINQEYMKGYIDDEEYQKDLKKKWFQMDVPITFEGYNDGKGALFPFWSSPSITIIMMITALSKYAKVIQP